MKFFIIILLSLLTPSCGKWEKMTQKDIKEDCMHMKGDDLELLNCNDGATFYAKPEGDKFAFDISNCGKGFTVVFNGESLTFEDTDMTNMPSLKLVVSLDGRVTANGNDRKKLDTITPGTGGVVKILVNPVSDCKLLFVEGEAVIESSAPGALAANTKLILIIGGALVGVILLGASAFLIYKYCLKKKADDVKTVVKRQDKDDKKGQKAATKASKSVEVKSKAGTARTQIRKKPSLKKTTSQTITGTEVVEGTALPAKQTGARKADFVPKKEFVEEKKVEAKATELVETKDVAPAVTPPVIQSPPVQLQNASAATTPGNTKSNVSVATTPVAAHQNEAAPQNNALPPKPDVSPVQACPPENKNIAVTVQPPVVIVPAPSPKPAAHQNHNVVPAVQPAVATTPVITTKDVVAKPPPVIASSAPAPIANVRPVVKPPCPAARKNVAAPVIQNVATPQSVPAKVQARVKPAKNVPAKAATSEDPSLEAHCIDTTDDHPIKNNGTEELKTFDDHCIETVDDHQMKKDIVPAAAPPPCATVPSVPSTSRVQGRSKRSKTTEEQKTFDDHCINDSDEGPILATESKEDIKTPEKDEQQMPGLRRRRNPVVVPFQVACKAVKAMYPDLTEDELKVCAESWIDRMGGNVDGRLSVAVQKRVEELTSRKHSDIKGTMTTTASSEMSIYRVDDDVRRPNMFDDFLYLIDAKEYRTKKDHFVYGMAAENKKYADKALKLAANPELYLRKGPPHIQAERDLDMIRMDHFARFLGNIYAIEPFLVQKVQLFMEPRGQRKFLDLEKEFFLAPMERVLGCFKRLREACFAKVLDNFADRQKSPQQFADLVNNRGTSEFEGLCWLYARWPQYVEAFEFKPVHLKRMPLQGLMLMLLQTGIDDTRILQIIYMIRSISQELLSKYDDAYLDKHSLGYPMNVLVQLRKDGEALPQPTEEQKLKVGLDWPLNETKVGWVYKA